MMKRCPKCKQVKHDNEFYNNIRMKDGLSVHCKKCHNKYTLTYLKECKIMEKEEKEEVEERDFNKYLGGYMVAILNHAKKGEYKYTIKSTTGKIFKTNDKQKFFDKLKDCLD